ncbi:MAG TPA: M23 family metallopeptidase, partial [Luteolibacter sp.]|nr:M23 family metallopeptidase [Luteolibacter sp.]
RIFEGQTSKPWQGGCYGYVRNSLRLEDNRIIQTRLHEGIDIRPMQRDLKGIPLDPVGSIAAGTVAYINDTPGHSNYGRYVVVEHLWENTPVYSLYAHLASISCKPGQQVAAGDTLGILGCTGCGIDLTRAHVHLELNLLLSNRYEEWAKGTINHHGIYNGINLSGCDIAKFFLDHRNNPQLKFSEFIAATPAHFKVLSPAKNGIPDIVKRYPWLCRGDANQARSWEISFSATGLPVAFNADPREVEEPVVTAIRPSDIPHQYLTRHLVSGIRNQATLGRDGKRLVELVMGNF